MYAAPFFITSICNLYGAACHLQLNAVQNAPKHNAKCTKTQCEMHQNAVRNAAKRRVKCTKTQCKMHQNAGLYGANGVPRCIFMRWNWGILA